MRRFSIPLYCLILCLGSGSSTPTFKDLTSDDFKMVVKNFSALTNHTSVSSATSLETWGFEVGVLGGVTRTPDVQSLVDQAGVPTDIRELPRAQILGRLTFPHSVTLEAAGFPRSSISGVTVSQWGLALQWTFTNEVWLQNWADMALKVKYAESKIAFSQWIQNASTGNVPVLADIHFTDVVYGVELLVSRTFGIIEPYVSLGYLQGSGELSVRAAGNATVFSPSFTNSQVGRSQPGTWQGVLGIDLFPTPFFVLGAEYSRAFDVNSWTGKLSLQFD